MKNRKLLGANALLIAASAYGFISGAVSGKKFATAGLVLFILAGGLGIAIELTNDSNVQKFERNIYMIANVAGVDLLMTDVCIASSVDSKMAALNLVPPALDLVMYYLIDSSWDFVTQLTHIVTDILFFFFAFRDTKYILAVSGIGFLLALFGKNEKAYVSGFSSLGVFATSWFLGGKDLKDMGIDI